MQDYKNKQTIKFSNENISDYINFQMKGLETVLKEFDYPNTLSCLEIIRSIFDLESSKTKRLN